MLRAFTSFAGSTMSAVLSSVTLDDFIFPGVSPQGESDLENVIALFHESQDTSHLLLAVLQGHPGAAALDVLDELVLHDLAGSVEEVLHHVEETGISRIGHGLQPIGDLMLGIPTALDGG